MKTVAISMISIILFKPFFFLIGKKGEYIKSACKMAQQSTHGVYKNGHRASKMKRKKRESKHQPP